MKTQHKHNLLIFLFFVGLIGALFLNKKSDNKSELETIKTYKKRLLEKDSLRKIDSLNYERLVNDLYNERELKEDLRRENQELYETIEKEKRKVVSYTKIVGKLKNKTSVIYLNPEEKLFHDYYPDSKEWFIHYFGEFCKDSIIGRFEFQPLRLDLVITEREKGLFVANLNAPSWLTISSLDVKTLPISYEDSKTKVHNFNWLFGGGLGYSYLYRSPYVGLNFGIRYNKFLYYVQGNSNQTLFLGINRLY